MLIASEEMQERKELQRRMINRDKIIRFIKENEEFLDEYQINMLLSGSNMRFRSNFLPDIVREVYSELDIIPKEKDIYAGFIDLIQSITTLDQDILEIGAGMYPSLAKRIALKQTKGTITVYDHRLVKTDSSLPNLVLNKEKFTKDIDVSNYSLMIGFMPCEATEMIISTACANNKDFIIALCEGGPHGDEFDYFEDEDEWLGAMKYLAHRGVLDNDMGKLVFVEALAEYDDPYPVMYNKRYK